MRRLTKDDLTIVDAQGTRYPPLQVIWKTIDTVGRTLLVLALLYGIGFTWEAFH